MDQSKELKKIKTYWLPYSALDTCPCCGVYTYDGGVCTMCLRGNTFDKNKLRKRKEN